VRVSVCACVCVYEFVCARACLCVRVCVRACVCVSVSTFPRYQHFNHLPEVSKANFSLNPIPNSTTLILIKRTIYLTLADGYT